MATIKVFKRLQLLTLLLLLCHFPSGDLFSQTYSSVVSDHRIVEFIHDEINSEFIYNKRFEKRWYHIKKRIVKSSLHWGLADWDGRWDRSEDVIFSTKFILTIDSLEEYFTKEDLQFFEDQYNGQIINDWNIKSRNSRFKESFKIDYYEYSIPLFSKDFKSAIFYRYYVCGSLCGYSALWIYQWDGEKWVRTKRIKGWMS